jgi:hypothetical protein
MYVQIFDTMKTQLGPEHQYLLENRFHVSADSVDRVRGEEEKHYRKLLDPLPPFELRTVNEIAMEKLYWDGIQGYIYQASLKNDKKFKTSDIFFSVS